MSVQFQPHSQYSVDMARAWRTDRLKGQEEEIEQEPGAPERRSDDKPLAFVANNSSSSSSSATTSIPSDALTLILEKLETMSTDIGTVKDELRDMRRLSAIQSKQINSLVDMSCPDRLLSTILCGYSKVVRDKNLTQSDKQFLESEKARNLRLVAQREVDNDSSQ